MTGDLSDDEDQMQMGREGGMDDDDDLEAEINPRRGDGDAHQRGSIRGRPNAANGQRQQRQQPAPYDDDDENF